MRKELRYAHAKIEYTLRRSARARRVRITVYRDGRLVVTMPHFLNEQIAERFVKEKADWIYARQEYFRRFPQYSFAPHGARVSTHTHAARDLVQDRLAYFNRLYNFKYERVTIKNHTAQWGSCSKKRNLNFNYRILFLPEVIRDYIIVHELCHLQELNHSRKFWDLVKKAIPTYIQIKKELRKYSPS